MNNIRMGLSLLETLTSALYEDPIILFREYVQNAVDSYLKNNVLDFNVKINVDKELEKITIYDNGLGIPKDDFEKEMLSIGNSDKVNHNNQIGFRGIGRLSAMPFCEKLRFINKSVDNDFIQIFSWDGKSYLEMLSTNSTADLTKAMNDLYEYNEEEYQGDKKEHFFKVELINYSVEVKELINENDFKDRLCILLPLKYSKDFSEAYKKIEHAYSEHLNSNLSDWQFDIYLNDEILIKPFENKHILESGVIFWPITLKSLNNKMPDDKIGLLWFSFNRKVTSNGKDEPRGIWVRSKNILVGDEYALANVASKSSNEYITTYRELTQTLNGVYGELLIDTSILADNTRRDWFKIDENSIRLRLVIVDFLNKLYLYRRKASLLFNDKSKNIKETDLIKAYMDLTNAKYLEEFKSDIDIIKSTKKENIEKSQLMYADEDIPNESNSNRKFYNQILMFLKEFYTDSNTKDINTFLKIRAFLKKKFENIR